MKYYSLLYLYPHLSYQYSNSLSSFWPRFTLFNFWNLITFCNVLFPWIVIKPLFAATQINQFEIVQKGLNFWNYPRLSLIWRYANKMKFWNWYFPQNFFNFFFIFTKRKIRYCFAQPEQHCLKCFPYIALNLVIDFVLWYNPNRKFESQRMTNISHFQLCNNPTPYLK